MILISSYLKLREGMKIVRPIYSLSDICLISEGTVLTEKIIELLSRTKHGDIWIADSDVIIKPSLISFNLKQDIFSSIKNSIFLSNNSIDEARLKEFKALIEEVVDEIINNKQCIIQLENINKYDTCTFEHSLDVAKLALLIGVNMSIDKNELILLGQSAILHDVGKILIPNEILNKPSKLTNEEFEIIKRHCSEGYNIIKATKSFDSSVARGALEHHEFYNGNGYPQGLKADQISIFGRILALVDKVDAMLSVRPYKDPISRLDVREFVISAIGKEFDPIIANIFLKNIVVYSLDELVTLSTGEKAIVIENNRDNFLRPKVVITEGTRNGTNIDLIKQSHNITIID